MPQLPTGTVTFLFTDIEGSTQLLQHLGREAYARVQDEHMAIMRAATSRSGVEIRTEGDSFFVVFPTAPGAMQAAVSAQRGLAAHHWPDDGVIRVRMGLHTGEGAPGGGDYLGIDVNRAARIAAAGHGGQIVVSEATRVLVGDDVPEGASIRDLGLHELKDFEHPERLHDLAIDGLDADFPPLRTRIARRTNLPERRTSFVGRERALAEIDDLLGKTRLLTLTGAGGTGKTRLALEAASNQLERFPDGVFFVDLSPLTDPDLVIPAIAGVLKVRDTPGVDLVDGLRQHLADMTVLLVLDNFEQLVDGSPVVGALLDAAPGLMVLATSRVPLHLSGEREHRVAPLELPERERRGDAAQLGDSESVRLFVDRARLVRPDFALVDANAVAIADIVESLDGLPLALELAASRLRVLDPAALVERLEHRLPLLTGGGRDRPDRHRTLEETIRWSHDLLEPDDRRLFARLSVFAGGWTIDAAEAVCGDDDLDVLDRLDTLVDASLVGRHELTDGSLRFVMLETIREYALARFDELDPNDRTLVERRHAEWFRDVAEEAERHLTGEQQLEWLQTLEREQDNIRAALDGAERAEDPTDVANGLRTAAAIWRFWQRRGALAEGRARLERLMALPPARARDAVRVKALGALGAIRYWLTEYAPMQAAYEEAVEIARELGDARLLSRALYDLSFVSMAAGQPAEGETLLQEGLGIADETDLTIRAELWASIGFCRLFGGDAAHAAEPIERGIALQREAGEWQPLCENLMALAAVEFVRGDFDAAQAHLEDGIAIAAGSSSPITVATVLHPRAIFANHQGRHRLAAILLGAFAQLKRDYEIHFPEVVLASLGDPAAEARAALGDDAYDLATVEGEAMSLEEIVELVSDPIDGGPAEPNAARR